MFFPDTFFCFRLNQYFAAQITIKKWHKVILLWDALQKANFLRSSFKKLLGFHRYIWKGSTQASGIKQSPYPFQMSGRFYPGKKKKNKPRTKNIILPQQVWNPSKYLYIRHLTDSDLALRYFRAGSYSLIKIRA